MKKEKRMNHEGIILSLPVMHFMAVMCWGAVLRNIFQ
jgi:hypothetical protein